MLETVMSRAELFGLLEYSCSLPTGAAIGKRWRCNVNAYPPLGKPRKPPEQHEWQIGEYVSHHAPGIVGISWSWAADENHEPHRGVHL